MNVNYHEIAETYLINTYSRYPITLIRGEGVKVWDQQGKQYLDFLSGIGCSVLGHCHPIIQQAITEQSSQIIHTSNLYYSPPNLELAKWLVDHGGLDKVFFCNSGTEANEAAIKLARKLHWQRGNPNKQLILSASNSFHGRTLGSLAATGKPSLQEGFGPMPLGFKYLSWNHPEEFCAAINDEVAAVLLEPIQGEGGIHLPPNGFLKAVRAACDKAGAVLIFDEIQCGLGRTGSLFAYQEFGVKPDIISLAKGIANGLPLGAICAANDVAAGFKPRDHGTTFGGNPISCAVALANLTVISDLVKSGYLAMIASYLWKELNQLKQDYPDKVREVRGKGLMLGIELLIDAKKFLGNCHQQGLLVNVTNENTIRLLPPFVITKQDIDIALIVMRKALEM